MSLLELPVYFSGLQVNTQEVASLPKHQLQHDNHLHPRLELWQPGKSPQPRCWEFENKPVRPTQRNAIKWALRCQTGLKEGSCVFLWLRHSVVSSRCSPSDKGEYGGGSSYPPTKPCPPDPQPYIKLHSSAFHLMWLRLRL